MRGLTAAVVAVVLFLIPTGVEAHTAHRSSEVSWRDRDTAAYVVSTVNLLRLPNGKQFPSAAQQRLHVGRYVVLSDTWRSNLYFIRLARADGTPVGGLAYRMGWSAPRSVTNSVRALGVARAPAGIVASYAWDAKETIGTFTSTIPG